MARNHHTFAKRQRELEKKRKAEEKRERRRNRGKADSGTESMSPQNEQRPGSLL